MKYPIQFVNKVIGAFGEVGEEWLNNLESTIQHYLEKWDLQLEGPVDNLSYNYVLKVIDENGNKAILKLGVPNYDFENEIRTLQAYDGKGCAKLLIADAKHGAMLLEYLHPGKMLSKVHDEQTAIQHFAKVWTSIRTSVMKNDSHPAISDWLVAFDSYSEKNPEEEGGISLDFIQQAKTYYKDLVDTSRGNELLHGDLHHENILYSESKGWMAIDPKGVIGDSYFDVISFLINQLFHHDNPKTVLKNRVEMLCEELQLEKARLLKAAIVMATLYACWGVEDKDPDWADAYTCAQWFKEFLL
ncbi:aminoglycoside phosphotransferase family protein [Psychrobacillus sp. NPDC093180]|uniref:aminoglycoside phosphotransferase family protein n=1 Tax=Psychrobacillus sp. NPDC093180 TaxID=3364489 RepID=UPI003829FF47